MFWSGLDLYEWLDKVLPKTSVISTSSDSVLLFVIEIFSSLVAGFGNNEMLTLVALLDSAIPVFTTQVLLQLQKEVEVAMVPELASTPVKGCPASQISTC